MKTALCFAVFPDLLDAGGRSKKIERRGAFGSLRSVRTILFLHVLLLAGAVPAMAQGSPPFFTDDAATAGKSQWVFDVGVSMERSLNGDCTWNAPSLGLAYGVTDRLELDYGVPLLIVRLADENAHSGLGNSIAGVKWRFFENEPAKLAVSVNPQIEFDNPTSSRRRGLVENNTEFLLPFQVQKSFGSIDTAFNVGRAFHARNASETDGWMAGLAVGRNFTKSLHLGVELYGEAARKIEKGFLVFNVGAVYTHKDWLSFLASIGRGVSGAERPDVVGYLGVQLSR